MEVMGRGLECKKVSETALLALGIFFSVPLLVLGDLFPHLVYIFPLRNSRGAEQSNTRIWYFHQNYHETFSFHSTMEAGLVVITSAHSTFLLIFAARSGESFLCCLHILLTCVLFFIFIPNA